jgi:hypothetical protein
MAGAMLVIGLNQFPTMSAFFSCRRRHFLLEGVPNFVVRIETIGRAKSVGMENNAHFVGTVGGNGRPRENMPTMFGFLGENGGINFVICEEKYRQKMAQINTNINWK